VNQSTIGTLAHLTEDARVETSRAEDRGAEYRGAEYRGAETSRAEGGGAEGGGAGTPVLALEGFSGPLEDLLALARARQIDVAQLSLADLISQLAAAIEQAPAQTPLARKADWLVMAAWVVHLRSLLLLPEDNPARQDAADEADALRRRLLDLQAAQTLAAWLSHRPKLGLDVFVRGRPEVVGPLLGTRHEVNIVEFLWASMALFDDVAPNTATLYAPPWLDLYTVPEARARILQRLHGGRGSALERLLPDRPSALSTGLRRRSAIASTFVAALELARQGEVILAQDLPGGPITVSRPVPHDLVPAPSGATTGSKR
jgi:segregation and condensation protein A